jgi:hypothetical protein
MFVGSRKMSVLLPDERRNFMAKQNSTATAVQTDGNKYARFITNIDGTVTIVFDSGKLGYQYCIGNPISNTKGLVTSFEWLDSSHLNIAGEITDLVSAIYPGATIEDAKLCSVKGNKYYLKEDNSDIFKSLDYPVEAAPLNRVDSKGDTLGAYIFDKFKYPDANHNLTIGITLSDSTCTFIAPRLPKRDIAGHIDKSKFTAEEQKVYFITQTPELYNSIESGEDCDKVCKYLEMTNKDVRYKLVLLYGGRGVGKTSLAEHISHKYGLPCVSITGDPSLTIEDICGYVVPNTEEEDEETIREKLKEAYHNLLSQGGLTEEQIQAEFDKIIKNSSRPRPQWKTIRSAFLRAYTEGWLIIINEVNNFSLAVLIGLNDAFYGAHRAIRFQGQVIPAHEKTMVICTTNFGYQGNNQMNEAFVDRFKQFYMTTLVEDSYGKYLVDLFPEFDAKGIKEFTKLMFKVMVYMEKTFENQDKFSTSTPTVTTRRFSDLLCLADTYQSLRTPLYDDIFAALHGVDDNITKTQGVLATFDKEILNVERLLFTNSQELAESEKLLKKVRNSGVAPSSNKAQFDPTDINQIFKMAKNQSQGTDPNDLINTVLASNASSLGTANSTTSSTATEWEE